jgi:transcriptional regulator with XRE-family HTH domain
MPNIGALLKEEIARLSRREIRKQAGPLKKASAGYRRQIAALKRQVSQLQRQVATASKRGAQSNAAPAASGESEEVSKLRFQSRGLKTLRARLGISAEDFGKLVGVSGQSVYNWEAKKATPRRSQIAAIAALRGVGKREIMARLGGEPAAAKPEAKKPGRKPAGRRGRKPAAAAGKAKVARGRRGRKTRGGKRAKG